MNSIVFVSVVFQDNLKFLDAFLISLQNQTKTFFDLLLINDQCSTEVLHKHLSKTGIRYNIVNATIATPSEIRLEMFEILRNSDYDLIVFGDSDDTFSSNRVEMSSRELIDGKADVVFNDITLVNSNNKVIKNNMWTKRLENLEIDYDILVQKNMLGLGNTAIKKELLSLKFENDNSIPAFDWIFYLQLLNEHKELNIKFVKGETYYRQHGSNTLGLKQKHTMASVKKTYEIKKNVYSFCKKRGFKNIDNKLEQLRLFKRKILNDKKGLKDHIDALNKRDDLFWFEETTIKLL